MIQLIKQNGSNTLYQTIYTEGRLIIQHQGIVGAWVREEDVRQMRVSRFKRLGVQILQIVKELERQGYRELNETDYTGLIVQFSYEKGQEEAALERRHMMEEVIHMVCFIWGTDTAKVEISGVVRRISFTTYLMSRHLFL
ncbi:hypothetical protein [Exiguobacterium sp. R-17]|uniref:hypothetical protein n=1 Tax=Exiguobacterium sp. R-17 TaxID=3404054 RepID=UPI003CF3144F